MPARGFPARPAADPDGQGCPGWPAGRRGRIGGQCRQYPAAPWSAAAPSRSSVPRRAWVVSAPTAAAPANESGARVNFTVTVRGTGRLPFVAMAAPSLSQLMHGRETGTTCQRWTTRKGWILMGTGSSPSPPVRGRPGVHARRDGQVRQRRPTSVAGAPSLLYGSFLAGDERDARILVITACTAGRRPCARPPTITAWKPSEAMAARWTLSKRPISTRKRCRSAHGQV